MLSSCGDKFLILKLVKAAFSVLRQFIWWQYFCTGKNIGARMRECPSYGSIPFSGAQTCTGHLHQTQCQRAGLHQWLIVMPGIKLPEI